MKEWLKAYSKLSPGYKKLIIDAIEQILSGDRSGLDIKDMGSGKYRCRVGKYRVIYKRLSGNTYQVEKLGTRGDIYK